MMRALARSMLRLSWAGPLFGVAQVANVWRGEPERLGSSLDTLVWTGHRHLGLGLQLLFQTADDLGREWIDRVFDSVEPGAGLSRALRTAARSAQDTVRIVAPGASGSSARQELRNKLEVYLLVRGVHRRLGLPPAPEPFELAPFVERALAGDDAYAALWVIEGLGHDYAARRIALESDPVGLLARVQAPEAALLMLHAGLGLALAEGVLRELEPAPTPPAVDAALVRFVERARASSRPGFEAAALESLGLVARCFFPHRVGILGRALARAEGALPGYFWHGVGRATYFLPINFLPGYGSAEHALTMARREAPDAMAQRNAVAGVVYAVALVNLSHPTVIEDLLRHGGDALTDGAFTEGVVSALVMRRATTPDDPGLELFLRHRPVSRDLELRWHELVAKPVWRAFGELATGEARAGSETAGTRGAVFATLTRGNIDAEKREVVR